MNRKDLLSKIATYLSRFSSEVEILNNTSEYDINIHSEDVLIPLLNLLFDVNLINANRISKNYPAIDLIDTENRIAFQVTATDSSTKLNSTLEKFNTHSLQKRIDLLYCYILKSSKLKGKFQKGLISEEIFNQNHIISNSILYDIIKTKPHSIIEKIHDLLRIQFSDAKIEVRSRKSVKEADTKSEVIFSNLVPITIPSKVHVTTINKSDKEMLEELGWKRKTRGDITKRKLIIKYLDYKTNTENRIYKDWIDFENKLFSFRDLSEDPIFSELIDHGNSSSEKILDLSPSLIKQIKFLIRLSFIERVFPIGLEWTNEERVMRFRSGPIARETSVTWKLGVKSQPRSVIHEIWSKNTENKRIVCFRHLAFSFSVYCFSQRWYISILPTYSFTSNGVWKSRFSSFYMAGIKRLEDNKNVYYHFRFIHWYLQQINKENNLIAQSIDYPYIFEINDLIKFDFTPAIDDTKWNPQKAKKRKTNIDQLNFFNES